VWHLSAAAWLITSIFWAFVSKPIAAWCLTIAAILSWIGYERKTTKASRAESGGD
jgi:glucan phosphoethanolaminetransferase (alkaline phosphatase superfamily)